MPYIPSLDILYTGTGFGFSDPMLDDRRALDLKVDFAEQGGAVVDQHAVVDSYQLDPFAAQRFADLPLATFHLDLSLRIHFQHPSSGRIFPARDRKSTRLNSSHMSISYAVFCLKKKISSSIATTTSRGPSKTSRACAVRRLSTSSRSPASHRSQPVWASYVLLIVWLISALIVSP